MLDEASIPVFEDVDLFAADLRENPFSVYARLRATAPVVYLARHDLYAATRYEENRLILGSPDDFLSGEGVALNETTNALMRGTVLASDRPEHTRLRQILGRPMSPARLAELRDRMRTLAADAVAAALGGQAFDAMTDLAMVLPLSVVSELVGLPEEGRERMLEWAGAGFNVMAPASAELCERSYGIMAQMIGYITDPALADRLKPGSWSAQLWDSVREGELAEEEFRSIIQGYVTPSLDTTIFAIGNLLWLLARNEEQWARLKARPGLAARCVNESLRLESPALGFSRVAARKTQLADCELPASARVMTLLPSANRDERRYADPDRFDIQRDASDHLAFGGGIHRCVGANLAMLEIGTVLQAIVEKVDRIEAVDWRRAENAMLRGFAQLDLRFH